MSLHGYPSKLFSDNGTQLVAANKELSNVTKNWDWNKLKGFGVTEGFQWIFKSADAPWQNGVTEALIRYVKWAINASIGDSILTFSELQTVLYEVANLLNERPIGNIEYFMESVCVRCLHTSGGVSEIEQVSEANEWDFWYKTTSV